MINYFCPDVAVKSGGIRALYQHVEILNRNGMPATIVHRRPGFRVPDMPDVPVRNRLSHEPMPPGDIAVVPEGLGSLMASLKNEPVRRIAIALNWKWVYANAATTSDWKALGIERILCNSPFIGECLAWSMRLPVHLYTWGVNRDLYYFDPEEKAAAIVFIERKAEGLAELKKVLHARDRRFVEEIPWVALGHLSTEDDYACEIRRAGVFLNLSTAEGLPASLIEAMSSGTIVAGYNGVGGQRELIGEGEHQNCILAENGDFVTLARRLEPVLRDVLAGDVTPWLRIIENGLETSAAYTTEAEEASVVGMWREILAAEPPAAVASSPSTSTVFDESKVDLTEHQLPTPFGTLCSVDQDHLLRYALARPYCRGKTVVDAAMGCGYGSLLLDAKPYVGVDRDENFVAFARKYYSPLLQHARYEVGDVLSLPLPDEHADVFLSFETIEHVDRDCVPGFLAEVKRVLKPGGVLVCSSPIYRGDRFGLASPHHRFEFRFGELERIVAAGGFEVSRVFYQSPFLYLPRPEPPAIEWTQGIDPHITVCVAVRR